MELTAFNSLSSISGYLSIKQNYYLRSLSGLDNINANSIQNLLIWNNDSQSTCAILSICSYLIELNGSYSIYGNNVGCASVMQVYDSCVANGVTINEFDLQRNISIYPNPTSNEISISGVEGNIDEVYIYNKLGQRVIHEMNPGNTINVSRLPKGLYIVEVVWNGHCVREKLIVQ